MLNNVCSNYIIRLDLVVSSLIPPQACENWNNKGEREECLGCSCAVSPDKETGRCGGSFSRRPSGTAAASAPLLPSQPSSTPLKSG